VFGIYLDFRKRKTTVSFYPIANITLHLRLALHCVAWICSAGNGFPAYLTTASRTNHSLGNFAAFALDPSSLHTGQVRSLVVKREPGTHLQHVTSHLSPLHATRQHATPNAASRLPQTCQASLTRRHLTALRMHCSDSSSVQIFLRQSRNWRRFFYLPITWFLRLCCEEK